MKLANSYIDEIFEFCGSWDMPSKCGLQIIENADRKIVIVTELYQDNPGTSITASAVTLAQQICEQFDIDPQYITYIECAPGMNSKLSFYEQEFFEVQFSIEGQKLSNPKYSKVENLELLLR